MRATLVGRIVVPIELRRTLGIGEKDGMDIFVEGEKIILRKCEPSCVFCGNNNDDVIHFKGKLVCSTCIQDLDQNAFFAQ